MRHVYIGVRPAGARGSRNGRRPPPVPPTRAACLSDAFLNQLKKDKAAYLTLVPLPPKLCCADVSARASLRFFFCSFRTSSGTPGPRCHRAVPHVLPSPARLFPSPFSFSRSARRSATPTWAGVTLAPVAPFIALITVLPSFKTLWTVVVTCLALITRGDTSATL